MRKSTFNPLERRAFTSVLTCEKRQQSAANTWWYNPIVLPILTLAFSALDGVTLYPVFLSLFAQSKLLLYVTTFGIALCLNFVPLIAARMLLRYKYSLGEQNLAYFFLSLFAFVVLFGATCYLRFETRNTVLSNLGDFLSSSSGNSMVTTDVPGALPMILVQCVANFVTSTIAFALSYMSDNPLEKRINRMRQELLRLDEHRIALECALVELNTFDYDRATAHEEQRFRTANAALDARRDALKVESDLQLEMLLHDADSNTLITSQARDQLTAPVAGTDADKDNSKSDEASGGNDAADSAEEDDTAPYDPTVHVIPAAGDACEPAEYTPVSPKAS